MAPETEDIEREVRLEADLAFELPDFHEDVGRRVRLPEQNMCTASFGPSEINRPLERVGSRCKVHSSR
jgi:hypothetical protein